MRRPSLILFAAILLTAGGFTAGWFAAPRDTGEMKAESSGTITAIQRSEGEAATTPKNAAGTQSSTIRGSSGLPMNVEGLNTVIASLRNLDPKAYAEAMVESEDTKDHAKRYLYRAALEMSATSEQAAAYLKLYKERRGLLANQNVQDLRNMLTYAGQREGVKAIKNLLHEYPDGFSELDSLVHGVALKSPAETVDWYNELPDDSKLRKSTLVGMMFGLGQGGTDSGLKIFAQLTAEDQATCISGFANAYSRGRGIEGAAELMAAVPEELRPAALSPMLRSLSEAPPEKFVPWAARYCGENPEAAYYLERAATAYARTSPDAAFAWAESAAGESATIQAAAMVIGSLIPSRPDLAKRWLAGHPDNPYSAKLQELLPP